MSSNELAQWLLDHAGPVIRFRTVVELIEEQDVNKVSQALDDFLESKIVMTWLERLNPSFEMKEIHSSSPAAFENVMGKLGQLGMRAGLQPFDGMTLPFRVWLSEGIEPEIGHPFRVFLRTIVASFLAYTGYHDTRPVHDVLVKRLNLIHSFAESQILEKVYVDEKEFSIPESMRRHKLVNPELYFGQKLILPWVHDLRAFASSKEILQSPEMKDKAERIAELVLSPEYQQLQPGYGLMKHGSRYYVIGWSVHLPNYFVSPQEETKPDLLLALEMMAPFEATKQSDWFRRVIDFLESHRTRRDTYLFPKSWMTEKKTGYWTNGAYMALEENRRRDLALECESTFRLLKIKQLAGLR
ncbi:MAG: hypothetical protein ACE5H4_02450 [Candidatus Thorarchaeota archaeon]